MRNKNTTILLMLVGICLSSLAVFPVSVLSETAFDNTLYAQMLDRHVRDGVVDYQGFKADEKQLDAYLDLMAAVDPDKLSRNEQFAFYINAYNAWTIKLILTRYPGISSIKDIGSFFSSPWGKKISRINGELLTLDEIEHEILRPRFQDPRIHFAVNCASKGCPKLISHPYETQTLAQQLDAVTRDFINNPDKNYLKGNTLYVSRIFKWFAEDFNHDIRGFFLQYASDDLRQALAAAGDGLNIRYLDYDWSLNGK
ncbi:MAG: DUF547 domain-containing protein [Desulfotignum sp.]|nr:DUF547 domain-containing protein [Desulfotignum sp.]